MNEELWGNLFVLQWKQCTNDDDFHDDDASRNDNDKDADVNDDGNGECGMQWMWKSL